MMNRHYFVFKHSTYLFCFFLEHSNPACIMVGNDNTPRAIHHQRSPPRHLFYHNFLSFSNKKEHLFHHKQRDFKKGGMKFIYQRWGEVLIAQPVECFSKLNKADCSLKNQSAFSYHKKEHQPKQALVFLFINFYFIFSGNAWMDSIRVLSLSSIRCSK